MLIDLGGNVQEFVVSADVGVNGMYQSVSVITVELITSDEPPFASYAY